MPTPGRTDQLRCHLCGLGILLVGDPLQPQVREVAEDDFTDPLQLLASSIRFSDPVDAERSFSSRQRLSGRPAGPDGA